MADPAHLEELLGHRFTDRSLLEEAITHASTQEEIHNERLEFLGDTVLNLVIAEELYARYPHDREGRLTELKSRLISRQTLGEVGGRLGLEPHLRIGGSLNSRMSLPPSVLGNALEALLGAIYLDCAPEQRLSVMRSIITKWLQPEFLSLEHAHERASAKQVLQFYVQKECGTLPKYHCVDTFEHPLTAAFKVEVEIQQRRFPAAWGTNKKEAERWAAWEALLVLKAEGRYEPSP